MRDEDLRAAAQDVVWLWEQWVNVPVGKGQHQMNALAIQITLLRHALQREENA